MTDLVTALKITPLPKLHLIGVETTVPGMWALHLEIPPAEKGKVGTSLGIVGRGRYADMMRLSQHILTRSPLRYT